MRFWKETVNLCQFHVDAVFLSSQQSEMLNQSLNWDAEPGSCASLGLVLKATLYLILQPNIDNISIAF